MRLEGGDPEDTFFCRRCVSPDRTDDCGHDDEPTCRDCCPKDHADELLREALRDWGKPT